jgi:capsular polysaccharide biosynthesis protein
MYPSSSNSRSKQLEEFSFGYEIHAERLMQLLSSNILLDSLDRRFDLVGHYGIDRGDRDWYDKFSSMANAQITFHKTRFVSVVVSVLDESPEMAAQVANSAAELVNKINANIIKEGAKASLEAVEQEFLERRKVLGGMGDSIQGLVSGGRDQLLERLRIQVRTHQENVAKLSKQINAIRTQHQVFDLDAQIAVINQELAVAEANYQQESGAVDAYEALGGASNDTLLLKLKSRQKGAQRRIEFFQGQLNQLMTDNGDYINLKQQLSLAQSLLEQANKQMQDLQFDPELKSNNIGVKALESDYAFEQMQVQALREQYQNALANYLDPVPMAYVISEARPSHKKVYPYTKVNIALGGLAFFSFGLILMVWLEIRKGRA